MLKTKDELRNAYFISDLHLTENRPDCVRAFYAFLDWLPESAEALFILGDFFDYWVGDDIETSLTRSVAEALSKAAQTKKIKIYFAPGNRDFSIGSHYCRLSQMTRLDDETLFDIAGYKVLVTHGDQYCLDDVSYLRYRRIIRQKWLIALLRKTPKKFRINLGEKIRAKSKSSFDRKAIYVDVDLPEIERKFEQFNNDILVHGHTHRANIHLHGDRQSNKQKRIVLGDWFTVGWYAQLDETGYHLIRFDIENPSF